MNEAIELLSAIYDEDSDSYEYYADETRCHYRVDHFDMLALGELIARNEPDAYSIWCSETDCEEIN